MFDEDRHNIRFLRQSAVSISPLRIWNPARESYVRTDLPKPPLFRSPLVEKAAGGIDNDVEKNAALCRMTHLQRTVLLLHRGGGVHVVHVHRHGRGCSFVPVIAVGISVL